jgi:hypothetical protein
MNVKNLLLNFDIDTLDLIELEKYNNDILFSEKSKILQDIIDINNNLSDGLQEIYDFQNAE